MKQIILSILVILSFLLINNSSNAESSSEKSSSGQLNELKLSESWSINNIKISLSSKRITIDKSFNLIFSMDLSELNTIWDVNIVWLENFFKFWENSSFRFHTKDSKEMWFYNMLITLKPRHFWKFVVWPATIKIWDKTLVSNTVEIEVVWVNDLLWTPYTVKDLIIKDLNDITWPKLFLIFSFWFFFLIFPLILLIFIFFLFKSILISVKNRKVEKIIKVDIQKIEKNPFLQKLEKIEKNLNKYNKSEFFSSINDLLREYIEFSWLEWARNMTYSELEKSKSKIEIELLKLIKTLYFEEFRENDDLKIDRKNQIIIYVKEIIK